MPKNWKYIKKLLEKEFLCEKLRGHITYDLTDYRPAPWYQQHFIMKYDGEVLLEAKQPEWRWDKRYDGKEIHWEHSNTIAEKLYMKYDLAEYEIPQNVVENIVSKAIDEADRIASHHQGVFGVHDIIDAIGTYLHSNISSSLKYGQDDFIKALAILDRRCGKRRLEKCAGWEYANYPDWLKRICRIRFEVEGVQCVSVKNVSLG